MLTCHKCNASFDSRPVANAHYRSRWHEYNLIRALNLLPPVTEAAYETANQQYLSNQENAHLTESYSCAPCWKSFSSAGSYNSHLKSRRHASTLASLVEGIPDQLFTSADAKQQVSPSLPEQTCEDESEWQDVTDDYSEGVEQNNKELLETSIKLGLWPCLLCRQQFSSATSAVRHLCRQHSVVVPHDDACDMDALYDAVGAMVLCQHRCLQCGRQHATLRSCQRHMRQKPHLTLPLPGPYDHCYRWTQLETSVILAATAATDFLVSGDEHPEGRLLLPTGTTAANRRSRRPRRPRAAVVTVAVRRPVVGAKHSRGGGMAVAFLPKKRRELYGRKPAHAKRQIAKNLHKFSLSGGPESHLFSQCIAESMTVEGSLYAISVSDDEDYERFAPDQTREIVWTDVELGENSDIFDCVMAAYDMTALMFKYDDACSVTLTDTYNPAAEQSCDDAAEIVYIFSRVSAMNFFGEVLVDGDTFGCLTKSDDGWGLGVEDGRVVDEDTLPSRDSCCTSAASDYCLMAECTEEPMTYCEAEARCLARGLRAASRSFHENIDVVDQTKLGTDEYYFWVNVYKNEFSEWKWLDDGSDFTDYEWCGPPKTPPPPNNSTENCAAIHFTDAPHKIEYYRTACNGTEVNCILCYDADDVLPAC